MTMRPKSLRAKLTLTNVGLLAIGIVVAACASALMLKSYLTGQIDDELRGMRSAMANSNLTVADLRDLAGFGDLSSQSDAEDTDIALVSTEGKVLEVPFYPADAQHKLVASVDDVSALAGSGDIESVQIDGQEYHVTAARLDDGNILIGASSLQSVHDSISPLVKIELIVGAGLLAILATVSMLAARQRLRPLEDMVDTASAIAEGDLSQRVPERGTQSREVDELRGALNTMLHQIEAAFDTRERTNTQLRQFVADASHELRTPLASIRGYLQLAERGMLDEEARARALARMTAETDRMAHIVTELLLLARLDQRPEIPRRPVDLGRLARDGAADLHAVQPDRRVDVHLPDSPVTALGDEDQLRQVVVNLVANVQTHTPADTPVTISVEDDDTHVRLRIADRGPGMSEQDADRIFDRFFRASVGRGHDGTGTGLGMSIVLAIVDGHGGTVDVDTAPGRGLAVTVVLPAHTSRHTGVAPEHEPDSRRTPVETSP